MHDVIKLRSIRYSRIACCAPYFSVVFSSVIVETVECCGVCLVTAPYPILSIDCILDFVWPTVESSCQLASLEV